MNRSCEIDNFILCDTSHVVYVLEQKLLDEGKFKRETKWIYELDTLQSI